ncbi:MAG: diadenylate cyclase CdaA [Thermodesulfovibrionales bacterium]|nr:diadenylate cyclase CdaA [Thermodesulfovibrionales bacterium]
MLEVINQLRWLDVLDIVIVTIIIYRILLIIKGTKAAKMLMGILFLLIVSFFSKYLELYTLDWMISSFWGQVVVALIVLFQPEIRRALAQMGETTFLQSFSSAEGLKSLEEIIRAAISLANKKVGALIVIERNVSLREYIDIGTPLDSRVSKELLLSIFHPTSPIHDGAVIIKNNRIMAAGCFLPIALDADLSKSYGTRHRAALGITEETDAVALVVSEETGSISLGYDGKLETNNDITTLRDKLTELFTKPVKEKTS